LLRWNGVQPTPSYVTQHVASSSRDDSSDSRFCSVKNHIFRFLNVEAGASQALEHMCEHTRTIAMSNDVGQRQPCEEESFGVSHGCAWPTSWSIGGDAPSSLVTWMSKLGASVETWSWVDSRRATDRGQQ
jgi:hypothetical protein